MELWGRTLRLAAIAVLLAESRPLPIPTILDRLLAAGDTVDAPSPGKALGDALAREARKGRVRRVRRGWYVAGTIPRTTAWRIRNWRRFTPDISGGWDPDPIPPESRTS